MIPNQDYGCRRIRLGGRAKTFCDPSLAVKELLSAVATGLGMGKQVMLGWWMMQWQRCGVNSECGGRCWQRALGWCWAMGPGSVAGLL
ncbi:hypothetical protein HBH70_173550 [Parastagonospora nodorum]|nr:hypothetical protein HBI10_134090 [Parastagonospora nodorum]KAH4081719.1 hypothetical protein HBH48_192120 [Parastagonospora nodorum]KAH4123185.1 hypothetical protein HBH45_243980 [Parastagonospora nodorum]KAH4146390.1 hypothetical protein HBH44_242190 [Parastagonospora nodorum]KAH4159128.1 hypothetical protein HBH43_187220 [Parastagonospora nodorum]